MKVNGKFEKVGCHCWMPFKSWLSVNCWAFDNGNTEIGWSRSLNSHNG